MNESALPVLPSRLRILEVLSESSIERTFRAVDNVLQREVMLKLPGQVAFAGWSAPVKERLLREARALAKVRHASIATIHWVEETAVGPLLVLDLPSGERLVDRLQRGPLDVAETIELGLRVGEALMQVHRCNVVHRAVGPSSIRVLPGGGVQLGSFTFAKEAGTPLAGSSLAHGRRHESSIGSCLPDYSAPEQQSGQAADARADVYALGCTLFRCLTGVDPYQFGQEHLPMPDLCKLCPTVAKPLAEVIRKCVLPTRSARYATAQDVVDALKSLRSVAPNVRPRRGVVVAAAVGFALTLLACVSFLLLRGLADAPPGLEVVRHGDWEQRYAASYSSSYAHVHGLFVGIGDAYDGTSFVRLYNPTREIDAVAGRLAQNDPQWAVPGAITKLREGEGTLGRILDELERIQNTATQEDAVLFYFAGHGAQYEAHFGLAAADVTGTIGRGTNYLLREHLLTFITQCKAKHVLVVLDCCHAGAVFQSELLRSTGSVPGKDPEEGRDGNWRQRHFSREFLCSAGANEQARDGASLSPFCDALLAHLTPNRDRQDSLVAACYLGVDIARALEQRSGHRCTPLQMPEIGQMRDQKGSFVFRVGAVAAK